MTDRDEMRMTQPRLRVLLDDGSTVQAQTNNADLIRWDMTRAKHKWPGVSDAPFLWLTFIAWAALRRTKAIDPGMTWEAFSESAVQVEDLTEYDAEGVDAVDPTKGAAEPV